MLLTDGGIVQFEHWRHRLSVRLDEIVHGRAAVLDESYQVRWEIADHADTASAETSCEPEMMRFRSLVRPAGGDADMSGHEQRARVLALRGLSQARDGDYERAQTTFASAARLDPRLDLALLPSFWNLSRRAHEAAVAALRDANRERDAVALTATLRTRFRPRPVRAINRSNETSGG